MYLYIIIYQLKAALYIAYTFWLYITVVMLYPFLIV